MILFNRSHRIKVYFIIFILHKCSANSSAQTNPQSENLSITLPRKTSRKCSWLKLTRLKDHWYRSWNHQLLRRSDGRKQRQSHWKRWRYVLLCSCPWFTNLSLQIGQRTTPSIVAFSEDGQRLVGVPAKRQVRLSSPIVSFLILNLYNKLGSNKPRKHSLRHQTSHRSKIWRQGHSRRPQKLAIQGLQSRKRRRLGRGKR